jgi:hypothetical protein|tara:strand:- start:171412 stop:171828 length:417 start_codon:yes stop_codon:yes gene_type:complete
MDKKLPQTKKTSSLAAAFLGYMTKSKEVLKESFAEKPKPVVKLDEVEHIFMPEMQSSLTAYFNVHSLDKNKPLYPGLVIPYNPTFREERNIATDIGYMVSTGEISEQGNHVFDAHHMNVSGYGKKVAKKVAVPFDLEM